MVAYRDLGESYFEDWWKRHHKASTSLQDREGKLSKLYEEIERDLQVGASQEAGRQAGNWHSGSSPCPPAPANANWDPLLPLLPGRFPDASSHPAPAAPSSAERFGGQGMSPAGLFLRTLGQAAKRHHYTIKHTRMPREREILSCNRVNYRQIPQNLIPLGWSLSQGRIVS